MGLQDIPKVFTTPHVGDQVATRNDDMTNFFCANLARYQAGEPLVNLVDKQLGFPLPDSPAAAS
jgi:D-3-phosphoglycerate dehydrogenase